MGGFAKLVGDVGHEEAAARLLLPRDIRFDRSVAVVVSNLIRNCFSRIHPCNTSTDFALDCLAQGRIMGAAQNQAPIIEAPAYLVFHPRLRSAARGDVQLVFA
jgi:hypothetical protein